MKIQLAGRLGNQLFQLAAALHIQEKYKVRCELFYDKFHNNKNEDFLKLYNFISKECSVPKVGRSDHLGVLCAALDKYSLSLPFVVQMDTPHQGYDPTKSALILRGYFQNPKTIEYGVNVVTQMLDSYLKELNFIRPSLEPYQCFHLRRGDYAETTFGMLNPQYYQEHTNKKLPLIISTDDASISEKIQSEFDITELYTPENSNVFDALNIMGCSSYFLSSNSTLSWWGGMLCGARGGETFIPEPWTIDKSFPSGNFKMAKFKTFISIFEG